MNTNQTEVALNHADCLRSQSNIGETIVHNICTGAQHAVPWGALDWIGVCTLLGVGIAFAALIASIAIYVIRGW